MFKKGPDIDKKKLLLKACDVKKDSLTRLKHFKTLIEHLEQSDIASLFKSHFSFIYHTFIDTFSTFDCNSKQRRDDLDCILFMLERILIYNPELVKKRWQFYSITFVMQKLLHQNNTWRLRQEGVRLFVLWYLILCDETTPELHAMFASLVPGLVPQSNFPIASPNPPNIPTHYQHSAQSSNVPQLPIKLCSIDPLVPMAANEQLPDDLMSFYLDNLLQFMVTQITKPCWGSTDEIRKNQELSFSFIFSMFKKVYLQSIFPNFNPATDPSAKSYFSSHYINQYVDEVSDTCQLRGQNYDDIPINLSSRSKRDPLQIDLRQSNYSPSSGPTSHTNNDELLSLSLYQSIVIRWLTRILRQDMIPGQDELMKTSGSVERRDFQGNFRENSSSQMHDQEFSFASDGNSSTIFQNMNTTSREMEVARRIIGTWPENISVVHELFRRAFLNYLQPASMKRVVNVYKEWICNGPNQASTIHGKTTKLGYTSFGELLQVFVLNSSNAFVARIHNQTILDEQVEMCKRIMNIYRYMVMKIYMNTSTWEQLLNVMLSITEHLFPANPPDKKESTIGGRIAPAFFQTFIVSWIRANLYVHISSQMWIEFHRVMKNLVEWRELIEEWSNTMSSLTRVLVKHVYCLNLSDLPLDKPQDRRRRPKAMKSFSTAEATENKPNEQLNSNSSLKNQSTNQEIVKRHHHKIPDSKLKDMRVLNRSNSDGFIYASRSKLYYSSTKSDDMTTNRRLRKIKSENLLFGTGFDVSFGGRSSSPSHTDVIDGTNLKDTNMILDSDQVNEPQVLSRASDESRGYKRNDKKAGTEKCVLLGGTVRGWTPENSVIMWRRMLGLFGNINQIGDPENHLVAIRCLAVILCDLIKTRENLGISLDNQSTPEPPKLIPPYNYYAGWLLESTNLPKEYKESCLTAYKLLCLMSIRRHDIELPQQYLIAFYESLHRGLTNNDLQIAATIIKNSTQILSLELPGSTCLVLDLLDSSQSILLNTPKETTITSVPREQAVQVLNTILSLHRPIKKLMALKVEAYSTPTVVVSGDIKTKVFDTLLACNMRPLVLDCQTRSRSICSMAMHVYQELCDKYDSMDIEKLFDTLLTELQELSNTTLFRVNCDLLRLFADHASSLTSSRPALVSSIVQTICQLIVRLSTDVDNKETIYCSLTCLEDWCIAIGKNFLLGHLNNLSSEEENLSTCFNESLITIVLRSLESIIHDEQYIDDLVGRRGKRSSLASKSSDAQSISHHSQNSNTENLPRDRTMTNDGYNSHRDTSNVEENKSYKAIKLACEVLHQKLITYLNHFPLRQVGAAAMSCCVDESDYLIDEPDLSDPKNSSSVCLLVVNESTVISFIGASQSTSAKQSSDVVHLIVRNLCGKYSWDASCDELNLKSNIEQEEDSIVFDPETFQQEDTRASMKYESDFNNEDGNSSCSLSSRSSTNRDCIGGLLNQLNSLMTTNSSMSSSQNSSYKKRNSALSISNPRYKIAQAEETMIALLTNQRFQELNYCERSDDLDRIVLTFGTKIGLKKKVDEGSCLETVNSSSGIAFEQCRQLIQQLGYLSWEKRSKIDSLCKSGRLLRELKNLDAQPGRETHKIAVLYVAMGQEDKNSILSNSSGSRAFEEFISGLGWEVNLASHLGFKGGLQANKSTGETSPYYCNSTTEVMFHVSTRIPLIGQADDESLNRKLRHLGNDEIHIIWSEHMRDYRRGIIPTEFGDVIIAIYPMLTFHGYYRIQISTKPDVPLFGPLFDNCIVHQTSLAPLVRATAINASRAKRLNLPYYQSNFEERNRLIATIVQNHKEKLSFEEFAVQLYQTSNIMRDKQERSTQDTSCCA